MPGRQRVKICHRAMAGSELTWGQAGGTCVTPREKLVLIIRSLQRTESSRSSVQSQGALHSAAPVTGGHRPWGLLR